MINALPVFIRTATKRDLQAVRDLLAATWHASFDKHCGAQEIAPITGEWHALSALERQLTVPNSEFLVADDGTALHGMAYASCNARIVKLHQLYVLANRQRIGTGSLLLAEMLECFTDADIVQLEVDPANAAAISFYCRAGFSQTGRTENCGKAQSGIPALIFARPLR